MAIMKDYYSILHVLPSAEIDVIKAAYKALARKYHPDTYEGDKAYAGKRMQEINDAFGVIGDSERRKSYDAERKAANQEDEFTSSDNDVDTRLEEDWAIACTFCPEAKDCYNSLHNLSHSLAYSFKSYLLDSKQVSECRRIQDRFRTEFLKNYFGLNSDFQNLGEQLILKGNLDAAKYVNKAVKVMGSSLNTDVLYENLRNNFHISFIPPNSPSSQPSQHAEPPSFAKQYFMAIMQPLHNKTYYGYLLHLLNIPHNISIFGETFKITYAGKHFVVNSANMPNWIIENLSDHPEILGK